MKHEIVIAGFGGQGVLSMGMTLAYAGMLENKEVSWMPSYGPEMRGGTANCTVIISDQPVSSPILNSFDIAVVLNQPSFDKFQPTVKPNGFLLYEQDQIFNSDCRQEIHAIGISATKEAHALKNKRAMNMIMLGALLGTNAIVDIPSVINALKKVLPERHHHLLPLNEQAIRKGQGIIHQVAEV